MPPHARLPGTALAAMTLLLGLAGIALNATPYEEKDLAQTLALAPSSSLTLSLDADSSLLVLSPHPDDESLCCAGAIQRTLHVGGRVSIVWMTSGEDSSIDALLLQRSLPGRPDKRRELAELRMREAREAASRLGVPADGQIFLQCPDGGLSALVAQSGTSHQPGKEQGSAASCSPGNIEGRLAAVLERVHPTRILAPGLEDIHPDHRATGLLALRLLQQTGALSNLRFWIVHGPGGWPAPRGLYETLPLPSPFPEPRPMEVLMLSAQEQAHKLQALRAHHTQMQVMEPFMLSFVRSNEIYFLPGVPLRTPAP